MRTVEMTMEVAAAIGRIRDLLLQSGVRIISGHSFVEYSRLIAGVERDLDEHFSINLHTISPVEGFWIVILDENDAPVGTVAARLDLLGPMTLEEHWHQYLPRVYQADDGQPVEIDPRQHSFCREVSGRVVYLGQMWIAPSKREGGLGSRLAHLVQLAALLQYEPDYVYCWMWQCNVDGGFAQACGYTEIINRGIRWKKPPAGNAALKDLWLAGNRSSRLFDLALNVLHGALED